MRHKLFFLPVFVLLITISLCACDSIQSENEPSDNSVVIATGEPVEDGKPNPSGYEPAVPNPSLPTNNPTPKPVPEFVSYTIAEVVDYYLTSDGAYAEGSIAELTYRFIDDPDSIFLSLEIRDDVEKEHVLSGIASYGYLCSFEESTSDKFESILYSYLDSTEGSKKQDAEQLVKIYEEYKAKEESNR